MNFTAASKMLAFGLLFSATTLMGGKEIEVKMQLDEKVLDSFKNWLSANAQYKGQEDHYEHYLNNPTKSFYFISDQGFTDALGSLRVRCCKQKGDSVCYKFRHIDPETNKTTHRDEHESKVASGQSMLDLFRSLGYTEEIIIQKTRHLYTVGDFEICIDTVKDIGLFVEVELKKDIEDVKKGLELIYDFLKNCGLKSFSQFDRSYTHMTLNPHYDFSQKTNL